MQKINIIVPCYNEEKRFHIEAFIAYTNTNNAISFLFVNDGSTDKTASILKKLATDNQRIDFLDLAKNKGKAEAIRQGMLFLINSGNSYHYVGYFDADLATPLSEIARLKEYTTDIKKNFILIIGSRITRIGFAVKRKWYRYYIGRLFSMTVRTILKLPIYDTQCGAKLIHKDYLKPLFLKPFKTKWLFDIEIIIRLQKLLGKKDFENKAIEVPLNSWKEQKGSKLRFIDFIKIPYELVKIFFQT